ncbi:MAG: hypothetical protein IAE78_30515 [Myxococcus sp.]|nr:hypothetical protein [Myxococcus sp.]
MKLSRQGQLAEVWREAGLVLRRLLAPVLDGVGPAGAHVAALEAPARARVHARVRAKLLGTGADRPFELVARAFCVRGLVPGARQDAAPPSPRLARR